jgi:hypothetical protein
MDVLSAYVTRMREKAVEGRLSHDQVPPLVCRDGLKLSVQASSYHYSAPRHHVGPWTSMEIGFPSKPVPELREWRQDLEDDESDEDCVFGWVPVEKILETIEKHGGCEQLNQENF